MEINDEFTQFDTNKKKFLSALVATLGIVTTASKACGLSRAIHYRWMQEDEAYKAAVIDIEEIAIDFAESKLHEQINKGEVSSTIFFLKTKAKRRGYVERTEFAGVPGSPLQFDVGYGKAED